MLGIYESKKGIVAVMTEISKSAFVPYSANQMLSLVDDVEKYPEFLKWCVTGRVFEKENNMTVAGLKVRVAGVDLGFKTKNTIKKLNLGGDDVYILDMDLVEGPFKSLKGHWEFKVLEPFACKITLHMKYRFSSGFFNHLVANGFEKIAAHLVRDFVNRADQLYAS